MNSWKRLPNTTLVTFGARVVMIGASATLPTPSTPRARFPLAAAAGASDQKSRKVSLFTILWMVETATLYSRAREEQLEPSEALFLISRTCSFENLRF